VNADRDICRITDPREGATSRLDQLQPRMLISCHIAVDNVLNSAQPTSRIA